MTPTKNWTIALGFDGEVIAAARGAPSEWAGGKLQERASVPAALREAARATVAAARRSGLLERTRVELPELGAGIELCALPAVGLVRMPMNVRELVRHAVAALEAQARALDVGLAVNIDLDAPETVVVDPEKVAWVVSAFAGNAMRYVRRGTRHQPGGAIAVTVSRDAARDELVVVIEDDGPGIPTAVAERLFRSAPAGPPAAGLTLSVARDIIVAHGGSLDLATSTDETDHGTTFTMRLPID